MNLSKRLEILPDESCYSSLIKLYEFISLNHCNVSAHGQTNKNSTHRAQTSIRGAFLKLFENINTFFPLVKPLFGVIANTETQETINSKVFGKNSQGEICDL